MAIMEIPGYNIPYKAVMSLGLTKRHENPHPHLNPLPEGEDITPPLQGEGQGGDGLTRAYSD